MLSVLCCFYLSRLTDEADRKTAAAITLRSSPSNMLKHPRCALVLTAAEASQAGTCEAVQATFVAIGLHGGL